MPILRDLSQHIRSIGQKMTASNIQKFGHKAMNTAHTIGRKVSNTLHKIEDIGNKAIPIVSTIASMAGYPELGGALLSASNGLKRIANARKNVDTVRGMLD